MPAAPLPEDEHDRQAALLALNILDKPDMLDFGIFPQMAADALTAPIGAISLVDADRQWFMASVGLKERQTPRSASFCAHAILTPGELLHVPDATRDPRFMDSPLVQGVLGVRAYAGAPILSASGHAIGALCVLDTQARAFSPQALTTLRTLAGNVGAALRLHGGLEDLRRQEKERGEMQATLALMFKSFWVPVLIVRPSGALLLGNGAIQDLSGYAAGELSARSIHELILPEHRARLGAALARQGADGEPFGFDTAILHKDGRRIAVHLVAALVRRSDREVFRVVTLERVRTGALQRKKEELLF